MTEKYLNVLTVDGNLDTQKIKIGGSYEPPIFMLLNF